MKKGKWSFLAGAALAGILVTVFFDIRSLEAVTRMINWRNLAPELRLAHEVGLISLTPGDMEKLQCPTRRCDFASQLQKVFAMLGISSALNNQDFSRLGIIEHVGSRQVISRKEAVEILCRVTLFLEDNGFLSLTSVPLNDFTDYTPPPKYHEVLSLLRERGIVKGFPDGKLQGKRCVSQRESTFLLYRFYEQIGLMFGEKRRGKNLMFVDLPGDHYIMESLNFLNSCGAFELVSLGGSFDGNRLVSIEQMLGMVGGILKKGNHPEKLAEIQGTLSGTAGVSDINRGQLALLMEILIKTFGTTEGAKAAVSYLDLQPGSKEQLAAHALAEIGIQLGYANGHMGPQENVTRFEALSILDAVAKRMNLNSTAIAAAGTATLVPSADPAIEPSLSPSPSPSPSAALSLAVAPGSGSSPESSSTNSRLSAMQELRTALKPRAASREDPAATVAVSVTAAPIITHPGDSDETVSSFVSDPSPERDGQSPANKSDVEQFISTLRMKQARIHQLLMRKPEYKR